MWEVWARRFVDCGWCINRCVSCTDQEEFLLFGQYNTRILARERVFGVYVRMPSYKFRIIYNPDSTSPFMM